MKLSVQQKITACLLILYWLALFISTHIPIPRVVQQAGVYDKGLHFLANLTLIFLFWFTVSDGRKANWRKIAPLCVLAVMIVYAVIDELTQSFIPGRSCDPRDFLADMSGACTGLLAFSFISFWPAGLLVTTAIILIGANIAKANLADVMPAVYGAFNLISYALLTAVWIQCIRLFVPSINPRSAGVKWLIAASAAPAVMLVIVKILSVVSARESASMDMFLSAGASVVVVIVFYFRALACRESQKADKKDRVA